MKIVSEILYLIERNAVVIDRDNLEVSARSLVSSIRSMIDTLQMADRKDRDIQRYKQDIIDAKKALDKFLILVVKKKSTVGFDKKEFKLLKSLSAEFITSLKKATGHKKMGEFAAEKIAFENNILMFLSGFKDGFKKLMDVQ